MNRVLRRTVLRTLSEGEDEGGVLSAYELLHRAPKNLHANFRELKDTCRVLERRQRIKMHKLAGARDVFLADLTPTGRRAYSELDSEASLSIDVLWILNEVEEGNLRLLWGAKNGAMTGRVMATLSQLLGVSSGPRLRQCLQRLNREGWVHLLRDTAGACVHLSLTPAGYQELGRQLAEL